MLTNRSRLRLAEAAETAAGVLSSPDALANPDAAAAALLADCLLDVREAITDVAGMMQALAQIVERGQAAPAAAPDDPLDELGVLLNGVRAVVIITATRGEWRRTAANLCAGTPEENALGYVLNAAMDTDPLLTASTESRVESLTNAGLIARALLAVRKEAAAGGK